MAEGSAASTSNAVAASGTPTGARAGSRTGAGGATAKENVRLVRCFTKPVVANPIVVGEFLFVYSQNLNGNRRFVARTEYPTT